MFSGVWGVLTFGGSAGAPSVGESAARICPLSAFASFLASVSVRSVDRVRRADLPACIAASVDGGGTRAKLVLMLGAFVSIRDR